MIHSIFQNAYNLKCSQKATSDEKTKITNLVRHALDRAESLKGIKKVETETVLPNLPSVPETELPIDTEPEGSEPAPIDSTPTMSQTSPST